jgi:transposase
VKLDTTFIVGCDLGDLKSELCVLDAAGEIVGRKRIATSHRGFRGFFVGKAGATVVLEAGVHSAWVSALLRELGQTVIVANPRRLLLIAKGHAKSDRVDAELLARLGRADRKLLSPIQHRGPEAQRDLATIRSRAALVETRVQLVNHVRGIVKSHGERIPKCITQALPRRAREALSPEMCELLEPVLSVLEKVTGAIASLDERIETVLPERYPAMVALQTIDCVGALTALTFTLTIDDPTRFKKSRDVGSYLGLCPRRRQSGEGDPELRITRCGDRYLRSLLVNCAQRLLGPFGGDSDLRRWGLALAARGKRNAKKRAVVAVARRMAVMMHRMSITGETWQAFGHNPCRAA